MFDSENDRNKNVPRTECIPYVLMTPHLDKGHILYTDNYYTSPMLAKLFREHNTYVYGTIKSNRKYFCKEIVDHLLEKGAVMFYETTTNGTKQLDCKFNSLKNKANNKPKVVFMLSTYQNSAMVDTGKTD